MELRVSCIIKIERSACSDCPQFFFQLRYPAFSSSSEIELQTPPFLTSFALSSAAIILSRVSVHPLDRLKVLLQTRIDRRPTVAEVVGRGYLGIVSRISGSLVCSSVQTCTHGVFGRGETSTEMTASLVWAHGISKLLATTLSYPFDVRYTQRATGLGGSHNWRSRLTPCFTGFSLAVVSLPVYVVGSLSTLSFLSLIFPLHEVNTENDFARGVAVGTAGALAGSVLSYPFDTVRRRVITGEFSLMCAISAGKFFRGLPVLILKSIPESTLLTYSYMCNLRYFSFVDLG